MANGIDTTMEADEAAHLQAVVDRIASETEVQQLSPRDHAVLLRRQSRDLIVANEGFGKLSAIIPVNVTHPADDAPRCPPFSAPGAEPRVSPARL